MEAQAVGDRSPSGEERKDVPRRDRIKAALGAALVFLAGTGFVGSASWAAAASHGSRTAPRPGAAVAKASQGPNSRAVATPTPIPMPSMQGMMQSMQEMMNRCSQMMASAGGTSGSSG